MQRIRCLDQTGIEYKRCLYYDTNDLYYKIWEKEYVHADNFKAVMDNNIYDNELILNFYGIIFDKEKNCRGYITFKSEISKKNLCELPLLFNNLKKNIERTNYVCSDLSSKNIVNYNNQYCLIDLDVM